MQLMVGFQEILSFGNPRYWSSLQSGNCPAVDPCREKPQPEILSFPYCRLIGIGAVVAHRPYADQVPFEEVTWAPTGGPAAGWVMSQMPNVSGPRPWCHIVRPVDVVVFIRGRHVDAAILLRLCGHCSPPRAKVYCPLCPWH